MWQVPGFGRLTAAYTLARLPVSVMALAIVLGTLKQTGSVAVAGWAEASCIVGMALATPVAGRLVDRSGTRLVLQVAGVAHVGSLALLAAATFGWLPAEPEVFLALAALAGATMPPVGPVVRTAWNDLVPTAELPRVNALESTLSHGFYVVGAGAVATATWLDQLGDLFVGCAVLTASGVVLLLRSGGAVQVPVSARRTALTAVFRQPGAFRVLAALGGWAMTLSGLEYAVIGWAADTHRPSLAGVVIGATAIAAILASAVLGGRHAERWSRVPTSMWMLAWAIALVPVAVVAPHHPAVWLFTLLAVVGRVPSVGGFTALIAETTRVASDGLRTETFAWRMTIHLVGSGVGAAACASIAGHLGPGWAAAAGVGCGVAVASILAGGQPENVR